MQVGNFSNVSFCFLNQKNGFLKYPSSLNSSMQLLWLFRMLFIVQLPSVVWLFVTPWMAAHQASLSFTISWSSLKFMSIQSYSYIVDNYISAYLVFLSMIVHNPMDFVYPIHISLVLISQGTVDHQHQVWKSSVVVTLKVSFCGWNVYVPATFIC